MMMTTTHATKTGKGELSKIIEQIDVEDFLTHLGVDYKLKPGRSGTQLNIKECPRCGGSAWKVFLNAETGLGNCFHGSCVGEPGFNLFSFTQHVLGGIDQAKDELRSFGGDVGFRPKTKSVKEQVVSPVTGNVKLPDSDPLPCGGWVHPYLLDRGFDAKVCEHYGWRWCEKGQFDFIDSKGQPAAQKYDQRIIIPVYDLDGTMQTFQGRDVTGTHPKKYLFPIGLPGTARFLYGAHEALGCEELVICEGVFSVAAAYLALREDPTLAKTAVVGSFGKDLTVSGQGPCQFTQLLALKAQGLKRVVFMWDSEPKTLVDAGRKALEVSGRAGIQAAVAQLPDGKDPNEVSAIEIRKAHRNAQAISKALLSRMMIKAAMSR